MSTTQTHKRKSSSRNKATIPNQEQSNMDNYVSSELVLGATQYLAHTGFQSSYMFQLDQAIESQGLPKIGSFVAVTIENPHLNLKLESVDSLVGCNIKDLQSLTFDYYPNVSASGKLFSLSKSTFDRIDFDEDEDDIRQDLIVELYGQVFDYTFNVPSGDDKIESGLMVHLITNPFTRVTKTEGRHIKIGCIIDSAESHSIHSLEGATSIREAFTPQV